MKHIEVILRASVYVLMVTFIEFGKVFKDVGAAKLKDYDWADWLVDIVSTGGQVLVVVNAYFDKSFALHMLNGGTSKPSLTSDEIKAIVDGWKKDLPTPPEPPKVNP